MTRKFLLPLALVGVTAMGVFAATGIGSATSERSDLAGDRERVTLDVERAPLAAGATTSAVTSAKKGKKVKIQHFIASEDVPVPANATYPTTTGSEIVRLTCPGKRKVLSGDYLTTNGVVADQFGAVSAKTWEFGWVDLTGNAGAASPGITCAKGVK
jgi:hypothetical protein